MTQGDIVMISEVCRLNLSGDGSTQGCRNAHTGDVLALWASLAYYKHAINVHISVSRPVYVTCIRFHFFFLF